MKFLLAILLLVPVVALGQVKSEVPPLSGAVMNLQMELAKVNTELAELKKQQVDHDSRLKGMAEQLQQQNDQMKALKPK